MKTNLLSVTLLVVFAFAILAGCSSKTEQQPCDGKGILSIENKLDSAITVQIVEARITVTLQKDYTRPFSLTGNNPYTVKVTGTQYLKDSTFMILPCDNKLYIVSKY